MHHNIELLAPVGSFESLHAAIHAGANSIYFACGKYNMRSRSSSHFSVSDLDKICSTAKKHHCRTYLTLNTVVYDDEIPEIKKIIDAASDAGIDAIIASDQALFEYILIKKIGLHLSTQVNISNFESLKFYSRYANAVVLARELSLEQISAIHQSIIQENICGPSGKHVQLEAFVHGALCMSISGKCYLSEHLHQASANRGACYQVCRRSFHVFDDRNNELKLDNPYILSPKDLCTINILDKLCLAGISIMKIEGRGRSPEYVQTVVEAYKKALEAISNNTYEKALIQNLEEKLSNVFNRGFWQGHYLAQNTQSWNTDVYGSKSAFKKIYVAKGKKYFKKAEAAEFLMESGELTVGDTVYIMGPTTGVIKTSIKEIRIADQKQERAVQGDLFSIPLNSVIRPSDAMYKIMKNT
jgi:U32 family peptidase